MNLKLNIRTFVNKCGYFSLTRLGLIIGFTLWITNAQSQQHQQVLSPLVSEKEGAWEREYWSKKEYYHIIPLENSQFSMLHIDADSLSFSRWFRKVPALPYSRYRLSCSIKLEEVAGEEDKAGAGFSMGGLPFFNDTVFKGSQGWAEYAVEFDTEGNDSFLVEFLLGKWGRAMGRIWIKDIKLDLLNTRELSPEITVNLNNEKEPMSPYIYGQFIEHMGKCIYGGIWAEMIADRKFYYSLDEKKSPWKVTGNMSAAFTDSIDTYSEHNKEVVLTATKEGEWCIEQNDLGLLAGKTYNGRIVVKADPGIRQLEVSLSWNGGMDTQILKIKGKGYQVLPLKFRSKASTDEGKITIKAIGKGEVRIAAISLMPEDNIKGFRADVIELMKQLKAPVYRWPGGNFVSGYNWKDGIGNPDKRPTRYERAWNGLEYNDVGVHEFMELCGILEAEANVAVNTGLGDAKMAAEEVEYFNGNTSTPMGKWRAENGHSEPYDVKLWAVGNEMFGDWQLGHMSVEDYVKKHNEVANAMRETDPDIELIAVGFPGEWNEMMYTHCSDNMTYISEHFYKQDWHAGGLMTHVKQIPDIIREIADEHRRCREEIPALKGKEIKIAMDEWNYWYGPHVYGLLGTRYFLRDALGIAAGLNEFARQSDIYYMANYAQTVNVIGAIKTTKTGSFLEGTGQVLKLYRNEFGVVPLEVKGTPEPLDISATITEDRKFLTLSVVNPTTEKVSLSIHVEGSQIKDQGFLHIITGEDDMVYNDFENEKISIGGKAVEIRNGSLEVPEISACIFKFELK